MISFLWTWNKDTTETLRHGHWHHYSLSTAINRDLICKSSWTVRATEEQALFITLLHTQATASSGSLRKTDRFSSFT